MHCSEFRVTTVCNTFCKDHFVDEISSTNSSGNDRGPTAGKYRGCLGTHPVVLPLEEKERRGSEEIKAEEQVKKMVQVTTRQVGRGADSAESNLLGKVAFDMVL